MADPQRRAQLREELRSWVESHLDDLAPSSDVLGLPIVDDFILVAALSSATDGPGEGVSIIGYLSSANSSYRTHGLLNAAARGFEQPVDDD